MGEHQCRLRLSPEVVRREVAFGVRGTFERTCAQAVRAADRTDQATCGARPEGDARDRGAAQDQRCKSLQPHRLSLSYTRVSFYERCNGAPHSMIQKPDKKDALRERNAHGNVPQTSEASRRVGTAT